MRLLESDYYHLYSHLDFDALAREHFDYWQRQGTDMDSYLVVCMVALNTLNITQFKAESSTYHVEELRKTPLRYNRVVMDTIKQEWENGKRFV